MNEREFQEEIFRRLAKLEQGVAATNSMLGERCGARAAAHERLERTVEEQGRDLIALWKREHKRSGAVAVWTALSGVAGAALMKFWPFGGQ